MAKALATLALKYLNDVDPFEMEAEYRPSNPNFVLYYETDVNDAYDDDANVVRRLSMDQFWDFHVVDMFLC